MKKDIDQVAVKDLVTTLVKWYRLNHRKLPWRETNDPYIIWLSEIILQQTRVAQGTPYFNAFVKKYPTIQGFADAPIDDILKLWQGLGYYSRARNMHVCANTVKDLYSGNFPNTYQELLQLKGIGKYTAAAIASICFDESVPVVDGNVYRVLSRIFGLKDDISKSSTFQVFFQLAQKLIPNDHPGTFNQSMMELGALVCSPKKPDCEHCPLNKFCLAQLTNTINQYPVKQKKIKITNRRLDYYVVQFKDEILIKSRLDKDIWSGLYEFILVEDQNKSLSLLNLCDLTTSSPIIKHILTHQRLQIQFHQTEAPSAEIFEEIKKYYEMQSIPIKDLTKFAVPKPIEQYLKTNYLLLN